MKAPVIDTPQVGTGAITAPYSTPTWDAADAPITNTVEVATGSATTEGGAIVTGTLKASDSGHSTGISATLGSMTSTAGVAAQTAEAGVAGLVGLVGGLIAAAVI
jgi:hypothetical protein